VTFIEKMKAKARGMGKRLVLPEGTEPRTIAASRRILVEKLASEVTLVGKTEDIAAKAKEIGVDLTGIRIADPHKSTDHTSFSEKLFELRKAKGMTLEQAQIQIQDVLWWGAMMVRTGQADAMVAGADNSTGNVLRASIPIIGTAPGIKFASSCFVMVHPDPQWGKDGLMIFADCAVIPSPTSQQLAEIALAAAQSCRLYLETEPVVALLSFSTKGSAAHESVDIVNEALKMIKEKAPELQVDGEMQADAALIHSVAAKKAPGSTVAGKANTLIFPDLNSGNIGYKLVQRLGGVEAFGPFLQGFAKPVSDLSRGCSIDDIVNTSSVILCQVQG